ncbi:hypothetical protein ACFONN_12085 [Dyella humi]|uniref:Uncharacterized protein n=1 Tax=Dyella humi TaxID=1770547 RepID=A0ABW8IN86_9GAMM
MIITSTDGSNSSQPNEESIKYQYQDRGAWSRFFSPKHTSINFSVKVFDGPFIATIPLMTVDHVSNTSDGEGFQRVVTHQVETYPLFLIKEDGSNSKFSSQFVLKGATQYQGPVSGAISAAQTAIKLVAPHSAVLTTLTEQTVKDASSALDSVLARLLSTSIDEEHSVDEDVGLLAPGKKGITVTLQIPTPEHEGEWDAPSGVVGSWTLRFAAPRPSVFSDVEICMPSNNAPNQASSANQQPLRSCQKSFDDAATFARTQAEKSPAAILQFQLISNAENMGSVSSFLKQQAWYGTSQKVLLAAKPKPEDVASFCESIKQAMIGIGLNDVDAGIVSHAMEHETWATDALRTEMEKQTKACGA